MNIKALKMVFIAVTILLASHEAYAWGGSSPLPTDPVLQSQYQQDQAANSFSLNQSIADSANAQAGVNQVQSQVNDMDKMKLFFEQDIRLYDAKRFSLGAFNMVDLNRSKEFGAGVKLTLKLGSSYEERQLEAQKRELEALKALVEKLGR